MRLGFVICEAHHNSSGIEVIEQKIAFDFIYDVSFGVSLALRSPAAPQQEP